MMWTQRAQHGQSLTEYMVVALAIITAIIWMAGANGANFQGMANRLMGTDGQTGVAFQLQRTGNGTADNFLQ